jgi:hypothetical protein
LLWFSYFVWCQLVVLFLCWRPMLSVLTCFVWSSSLVCFSCAVCKQTLLFTNSFFPIHHCGTIFHHFVSMAYLDVVDWSSLLLLVHFVIYSCIIMSSGVSGVFHECAGCHRMFKRLATSHIVQCPMCQQVYVTCQDDIPPDGGESNVSTGLSSRRSTRWLSSTLLPRTAGSMNGLGSCNDVRLPPRDASATSEGTFCLSSHILFRHLPSLDAFLFWLQHKLFRIHTI